jgi:hypothetical protein
MTAQRRNGWPGGKMPRARQPVRTPFADTRAAKRGYRELDMTTMFASKKEKQK